MHALGRVELQILYPNQGVWLKVRLISLIVKKMLGTDEAVYFYNSVS